MPRKFATLIRVWLALIATSGSAVLRASQASELQTLSAEIRVSLAAQQPEFTIEREVVSEDYVVQRWAYGAERVVITLRDKTSYEQAVDAINVLPGLLAGSAARDPLPPGLATDGFMLVRHGRGGTSTLYFVKGKRVVKVRGPSEQIATWFAFKVAEHLPS
jgi:hypothetical protein